MVLKSLGDLDFDQLCPICNLVLTDDRKRAGSRDEIVKFLENSFNSVTWAKAA